MMMNKFDFPPKSTGREGEREKKSSIGRKFRKGFLNTMMAVVASSQMAQAAPAKSEGGDVKDNPKDQKTINARETVGYGAGAYITSVEDFARLTTVNFSSYFETDEADITGDNIEKASETFATLLSSINKENVDQFLASQFVIVSSCDPRLTNKWGNNFNLAQARGEQLEKVLKNELNSYDFSKAGLSSAQIKLIKSITFSINPVSYEGAELGVTPLTTFNNPKTGKNYSEEEIANLDEKTKEDLYQQARFVILKMEVVDQPAFDRVIEQARPKEILKTAEDAIPEHVMYKKLVTEVLINYKKASILIDNSPSMKNSKDLLSQAFSESKTILPSDLNISTFSSGLDGLIQTTKPEETINQIFNGKGDPNEKTGHSIESALTLTIENNKMMKPELQKERGIVVAVTDESIQDLSKSFIEQLEEKSLEANSDIAVILLDQKTNQAILVSLAEIKSAFQKAFETDKSIQAALELNQKHIDDNTEFLARAEHKGNKKDVENFTKYLAHAKEFREDLLNNKTVNVTIFSLVGMSNPIAMDTR